MEPLIAIESEPSRLMELRKYNILDTLTEKDYDDITFMASLICDVPIALISFVDENRQWFKSHKGIDASETPLEYSFCAHALKSPNEPLIVPDSRKDDRFKTNPLVTGSPNIVFYAGVPLINENGFGLGTVCVIDTKPRKLSEKQLTGLQVLSSQVMNLLSMRKTNANLQVSQLQLESRNQELIEAGKKLEESEAQLRMISEGQKLFNSELEKQVAERTAQLEDKNVDLERMNKELQSFAYISSHDLQEPLRKIQAFSWRIMEKEQEGLSEKAKNYFTRIQDAAKRMQILINDLLSYSSTNTAERVFEHINLSDIINEVKEDLKEEIEAKQALVEASGMCEVNIIPFQFRQLLQNLFTNSLKFSRPEKSPIITITSKIAFGKSMNNKKLSAELEYCHISFSDNGIGFEPVYAERVFELFQRLNGTSEYKGTGIGLAIVKKIVENHNGTISAESELGKGATFNIYLPLQKVS